MQIKNAMRPPKSFMQRHEVVTFYETNKHRAMFAALGACWPDEVDCPWGPLSAHDYSIGKWSEHISESLGELEGVEWPKVLASAMVAITICAQGQIGAMEVEAQAGFTGAIGDDSIAQ
jgi:hypothetical protein